MSAIPVFSHPFFNVVIETGRYFFKYIVSFSPDRLYNGQPVTEPVYAILAPERHDLVGFTLKFPGKAFGDLCENSHKSPYANFSLMRTFSVLPLFEYLKTQKVRII